MLPLATELKHFSSSEPVMEGLLTAAFDERASVGRKSILNWMYDHDRGNSFCASAWGFGF